MSKHYCPDCVEPLIKNRKKFEGIINWLVCPKCGFRTRETRLDSQAARDCNDITDRRKEDNRFGGYKGDYEDFLTQ